MKETTKSNKVNTSDNVAWVGGGLSERRAPARVTDALRRGYYLALQKGTKSGLLGQSGNCYVFCIRGGRTSRTSRSSTFGGGALGKQAGGKGTGGAAGGGEVPGRKPRARGRSAGTRTPTAAPLAHPTSRNMGSWGVNKIVRAHDCFADLSLS